MDLKPNRFGKYKKEDILKAGYKIAEGLTYSELKELGIFLTEEERKKHILGFKTGKGWRGYVPVYDPFQVEIDRLKNEEKED